MVEAVVLLDILVRRRLVTAASLETYARGRQGSRGWRRLVEAATLVDPGAESPQESRLRVRLVRAGLPRPARVDLAWPEHKIAVEYDGASARTGSSCT